MSLVIDKSNNCSLKNEIQTILKKMIKKYNDQLKSLNFCFEHTNEEKMKICELPNFKQNSEFYTLMIQTKDKEIEMISGEELKVKQKIIKIYDTIRHLSEYLNKLESYNILINKNILFLFELCSKCEKYHFIEIINEMDIDKPKKLLTFDTSKEIFINDGKKCILQHPSISFHEYSYY